MFVLMHSDFFYMSFPGSRDLGSQAGRSVLMGSGITPEESDKRSASSLDVAIALGGP